MSLLKLPYHIASTIVNALDWAVVSDLMTGVSCLSLRFLVLLGVGGLCIDVSDFGTGGPIAPQMYLVNFGSRILVQS